ncbi:MAG: CapA family protein [Verrucomicrobia bacterium]|nr:CapA family protein [Cytophagales bacterium]
MRKIFFIISGLATMSAGGFFLCNPKQTKNIEKSFAEKQETVVLFAVTGFGSEKENISLDTLKINYASGEIFVLEKSKTFADDFFRTDNKNIVKTLQDFVAKNPEGILICDLENLHVQTKALKINNVSFFEEAKKYPLIKTGTDKNPFDFKKHITKFMHTGVTAIARASGRVADVKGTDFLTEKLKPYFQEADFVHISNEVSMSKNCEYKVGTQFCTKERDFQALLNLRCNVVELTGNHNRDYGKQPFIETFNWYKKHNIKTFGGGLSPEQANTPLVITLKDGKKIGFIGFNEACPLGECAKNDQEPGANFYEKEKARQVIEKMKKELKLETVIVSVQFSESDTYYPTSSQKRICKDLVDFGADVVYGSQAHQVQYVGFYKNKPVFYGLGNFMFDQIHRIGVRQGFFLKNYFYKGKMVQSIPVFTMIDQTRRVAVPATTQEAKAIRKEIFKSELLYP